MSAGGHFKGKERIVPSKRTIEYIYNFWQKSFIHDMLCMECRKEVDEVFDRRKNDTHKLKIQSIESQPGDSTRYAYFVYEDGFDEFCFMPKDSQFRFPQRLSYFECKDLDTKLPYQMEDNESIDERLIKLADKHSCNIWTLKECIRTMKEMVIKRE